jgi:hypothetical protein
LVNSHFGPFERFFVRNSLADLYLALVNGISRPVFACAGESREKLREIRDWRGMLVNKNEENGGSR